MRQAPVIALLTDVGLRDPYVGILKGVILSACPDARAAIGASVFISTPGASS